VTRVLITGGAGFIGSHLARRLRDGGYEVVIADDLSTGSVANVPEDIELIRIDLGDRAAEQALAGLEADVICHLAGQSSGEKSFDDPVGDLDANTRSTALLSAWALRTGVSTFIQASSMSVYGQPERLPMTETGPTAPISYYGASKLAAERILAIAAGQGLRTVSMRMFSVYGPGQDLTELRQGMASIYLAYMLAGREIPVTGPLDRQRDLVHVDDVVEAWMRAIEHPVTGAFNLGTGVTTTVAQLIRSLAEALGLDPDYPVRECPSSPGDQTRAQADISRAKQELGWTPTIAVADGLASLASGHTALRP
jgi:UDP-glucose 4-epimerase